MQPLRPRRTDACCIGRRNPLAVELVNIETDDTLLRRYMFEIPVIAVDGAEVAKAPIYERALEETLAGLVRD